jgi:hypothetical protein
VPCHDRHCCQAPAARAESSVTVSLLFSLSLGALQFLQLPK